VVRVETPNPGERLKAGMFVEVSFPDALGDGAKGAPEAMEVAIPSEVVQRIGERPVVFISEKNEPGYFKMRFVELGGEINGIRRRGSGPFTSSICRRRPPTRNINSGM
jgi:multidrug efflux pump subunit AcrA (membrane-fusion protein)